MTQKKTKSTHVNPARDFLRAVGENIRRYRKKRGLTLEALGEDVGLDKGNMHRIEAGKNITLVTLLKLSVFLDVDPVKIIDAEMNISPEATEDFIRRKKKARKKR